MAEEQDKSQKTEAATPQKLQEARKKGDVAKSQELPSWLLLATSVLVLAAFSGPLVRSLANWLKGYLAMSGQFVMDGSNAEVLARETVGGLFMHIGLIIGFFALAGFAGHVVQTGFLWAPEKITPKPDKLNPVEGLKRLFGTQSLMNFAKGLGKMGLIGLVVFMVLWPKRHELASLPWMDLSELLPLVRGTAIALMLAAVSVFAFIAAGDYFFQRWQFLENMRMSRRDIRDEMKNTEGDPQVRARLRQIRTERARQRMMQAVPQATVVIANPTHFAVALKYTESETPVPVCVAKGVDEVALRIRKIAEDSNVPVVEDPPLARALHASVELDHEIPEEHFRAVAKVLGFVFAQQGRG